MTINAIAIIAKTVAKMRAAELRGGKTFRSKFEVAKRVRARRRAIPAKTATARQMATSHSQLI
jgi:hypothetical protein